MKKVLPLCFSVILLNAYGNATSSFIMSFEKAKTMPHHAFICKQSLLLFNKVFHS